MIRLHRHAHLRSLEAALAERFGWKPGGALRDAIVDVVRRKASRLEMEEASYCRMAIDSPGELDALAEAAAPSDARFFRFREQVEAVRDRILPDLLARRSTRRRLRIWSLACATGEEAYSLALLVRDVLPPDLDWRVEILATDLRGAAIATAARGRYPASGLRSLDPTVRNRYFIRLDGAGGEREYELIPLIRRMIAFRRANLVEPRTWIDLGGPFDLIVCWQLLLYFHRAASELLCGRMAGALAPDGYLLVGPSEPGALAIPPLERVVALPDGIFRREI